LDRLAASKQNIGMRWQENDAGLDVLLAAAVTTNIAAAIHAVDEVPFSFHLQMSPHCDPLLMFLSLEDLKIIRDGEFIHWNTKGPE
jgi:hypothetical protein